MSAGDLINCLSGDLLVDPYLVLEAIREDSELREVFRETGRDFANYPTLLERVSELF